MELDIEKLKANLYKSIRNIVDENGIIHAPWENGVTICGLRPTEKVDSKFPPTKYSLINLYTKTGESTRENLIYFSVDEYLLSLMKYGYLKNTYNQIEAEIKNKEFVSFKTSWNQTIVDEVEKKLSIEPIGFRMGRFGKYKPWYMDETPYVDQPDEELILPENYSLSNLDDCIQYLRNISSSDDSNWDCSILDIKFSASDLYTITKEVYIFQTNEQSQKDRPYAFINEIKDNNSFSILAKELIKNNLWSPWQLFFKTYKNGTSEIFIEDGDRRIVPFWMKNKIKGDRLKEIEAGYTENNQLFKQQSFTKDELVQSIFDNLTIDSAHYGGLAGIKLLRDKKSLHVIPEYIHTQYNTWFDSKGEKLYQNISQIYNQSLLFQSILNLINYYYPQEKNYWKEFFIDFKYTEIISKGLADNYDIKFESLSDTIISGSIFQPIKVFENQGPISYSYEEYAAIEKQLDEEEVQEKLNQNEPITSDYLLQNIYGCISANVPNDFASIEAVITRSFDGDTQQLSGSYSYKPKGLFSSSKPVEPGEQIYPINVTVRLLDEFYIEESKNWRKAVLTFKNDATCNVKIGK